MILAIIFLLGFSWTASPTNQSAPSDPRSAQGQEATPPTATTGAKQSSPASTSEKKPANHPRPPEKTAIHKKKKTVAGCDASPATSQPPTSNPATVPQADPTTAGNTPAQNSEPPTTPKNCPPAKTIVRQGGTAEPSIQLAGGPGGGESSQERDAAHQMLAVTETNLKKVAGQQLNSSQQASVTQIRQFVEQSKTALADGDTERARTLAWKAELLSQDLVKPQN